MRKARYIGVGTVLAGLVTAGIVVLATRRPRQPWRIAKALLEHSYAMTPVVFVPGSRTAALIGEGPNIKLLETDGWTCLTLFEGHEKALLCAAASPDGRLLASVDRNGTAMVWDLKTRQRRFVLGGGIRGVFFSPDGGRMATTGGDGYVPRIWDARTGASLVRLGEASKGADTAEFSPKGELLVTGSLTGATLDIWNSRTGAHLRSLGGGLEYGSLRMAGFLPDGRGFLALANNEALLFDGVDGTLRASLPHRALSCFALAESGDRVATGSFNGDLILWNAISAEKVFEFDGHVGEVLGLQFMGDSLLSYGSDDAARIWNVQTGKCSAVIRAPQGPPYPDMDTCVWAVVTPDGTRLALRSSLGLVSAWAYSGDN